MDRSRRLFWVFFSGVLLIELAWVLALPTFRGMDEVDHVFRAESLVHGQLLSRQPARHGRGELVTTSADLAAAARRTCESYKYTGPDNCVPVSRDGDRVQVASAAARYNPTWYAVAGMAALPFDGVRSDLAMRTVAATAVALLMGWAAALTTRWRSPAWALTGVILSFTPMTAFSGAIAAPNAVGYAAGILLWVAVLVALDHPRPPLAAIGVAVLLLAHTHTTGSLWLALTVVALMILRPPRAWLAWIRTDPRRRSLLLGLCSLAVLSAVAWVRIAGTNAFNETPEDLGTPGAGAVLNQVVTWLFQTIGAFPHRAQPAPTPVYALWLLPTFALISVGLRFADRRTRRAALWLGSCWVLVPVVLTLVSYAELGFAWQGRYAAPLAVGVVLLSARGLAGSRLSPRPWSAAVVVGCALAHACSVVAVTRIETGRKLSFALADHLPGTAVLLGVLALLGGLAPLLACLQSAAPAGVGDPLLDKAGADR